MRRTPRLSEPMFSPSVPHVHRARRSPTPLLKLTDAIAPSPRTNAWMKQSLFVACHSPRAFSCAAAGGIATCAKSAKTRKPGFTLVRPKRAEHQARPNGSSATQPLVRTRRRTADEEARLLGSAAHAARLTSRYGNQEA